MPYMDPNSRFATLDEYATAVDPDWQASRRKPGEEGYDPFQELMKAGREMVAAFDGDEISAMPDHHEKVIRKFQLVLVDVECDQLGMVRADVKGR